MNVARADGLLTIGYRETKEIFCFIKLNHRRGSTFLNRPKPFFVSRFEQIKLSIKTIIFVRLVPSLFRAL